MKSIRNNVLAFCLALASFTTVFATQVCPYNVSACSCSADSVSCFQLQEIPPLTTGSNVMIVTTAIFDTGNITTLHNGSLPSNLVTLEFTGHPLTNISDDAFESSATTLDELSITKSGLTKLPEALLSLANLRTLTIANTHIDVWDKDILQHIANTLTDLHLPNVGLHKWPRWFSSFHLLTSAELSRNSLGSIPEDGFNSTNTLLSLKLEQCNLTSVPLALSNLMNLTFLDIGGNNINDQEIKGLASLTFVDIIQHISLNSMNLTRIPDFTNMTSLQELFLDGNQIANASVSVYHKSLRTLHLESNKLRSVPDDVDELVSLATLRLAFNEITELSFDLFPKHLTYLDLSHNQIIQITKAISSEQSTLGTLFLNNNPLSEISSFAFVGLQSLRQIDLQFTRLTRLPLALQSLQQLSLLQMSNIASLSCSSLPPENLVNWVRSFSLGSVNIYGDCSNGISIYDYLTVWSTTRKATTQREHPATVSGPQVLTTGGNITATDDADVLQICLLQTCIYLFCSFSAIYYL